MVNSVSNSHTDQYISWQQTKDSPGHERYRFNTKSPASGMMFSQVPSNGLKIPMIFMDKGIKSDSNVDLEILEMHMDPGQRTRWSSGRTGCQPITQTGPRSGSVTTSNITGQKIYSHHPSQIKSTQSFNLGVC